MLSVVFIGVCLLSFFGNFCFQKSNNLMKIVGYVSACGLGYVFANISPVIPDYSLYEASYNNINGPNIFEYGYRLLEIFGNKIGLNYIEFRLVIGVLGMLLIFNSLYHLTNKALFVFFLYAVTLFAIDMSQVRNYLLMVCIVKACSILGINANYKWIKIIFLILLGASFQSLGYIYLLIVLVYFVYTKLLNLRIVFSIGVILEIGISMIPAVKQQLEAIISNRINNMKLQTYLSVQTKWGFLLFWSTIVISFVVCWYTYKLGDKSTFVRNICLISFVSVITLPLLMFNSEFFRIYRDLLLVIYSGMILGIGNVKKYENRIIPITLFIIVLVINFWLVIVPIWNSNVILIFT